VLLLYIYIYAYSVMHKDTNLL